MSDPIAALHARYRASFPEKRDELIVALVAWHAQPQSTDTLAALYLLVHKLAGSAGAYGFDTLGELARSADLLLQSHARGGEALGEDRVEPIVTAVEALCAALASA